MKRFNYEKGPTWGLGVIKYKSLQLLKFERMSNGLKNKNGKVLEIGCGGGRFLSTLSAFNPGLELYGNDINPNIIEENKKINKNIDYRVGDMIKKLPYDGGYFDFVFGIDVLEHVEDIDKALTEIKRILKKGGRAFFSIPIEKNYFSLWKILISFGYDIKKEYIGHVQRLNYKDVINLSKKHGFKIRDAKYNTFLIGQIFDIAYYSLWKFKGLGSKLKDVNSNEQLEPGSGAFKSLLFNIKQSISVLTYYESKIFSRLSPFGNSIDILLEK